MNLLTLNAGSSSLKYALFARDGDLQTPLKSGQVEGLGGAGLTHAQALQQVLAQVDAVGGAAQVWAVGHRIVHGGTVFKKPVLIDDSVQEQMAALQTLAPLHQPHNLAGVQAARAAFPGVPQVACFDTAFHGGQPEVNQRFALPQQLHDQGVRRYGFHGLSYQSIQAQLQASHPALAQARVVVAHLGNGASMCAMRGGRSVATTMSFSPLDGLPMGTRCGRLDAAVVLHLLRQGHSADDVSRLLHQESGLLGLSGLSSDLRTLLASAASGKGAGAVLAVDYFVEHILRELAGMAAALRGIDALVFTGGIGENAATLRARVLEGAKWMGLALDNAANLDVKPQRISTADSAVAVLVLNTNEESIIAHSTADLTLHLTARSATA